MKIITLLLIRYFDNTSRLKHLPLPFQINIDIDFSENNMNMDNDYLYNFMDATSPLMRDDSVTFFRRP